MTLAADLQKFQERRRFPDWKPDKPYSPYHAQSTTATEVIKRALAFLDLELVVGEWVVQALERAYLKEAVEYVHRNSADELKHDEVLSILTHYVGGSTKTEVSEAIVRDWQKQQPSFSLAYALEMGVFFSILPALTKHGDMYCVKVSQWISDDEGVHVLTNGALAKHLGEKLTKDHLQLVVRTLAYVFEPLGEAEVKRTVERAIRRLNTGKDPDMMQQSVPVTPAFFEQVDKRSIVY